jgi:hypothetical protein
LERSGQLSLATATVEKLTMVWLLTLQVLTLTRNQKLQLGQLKLNQKTSMIVTNKETGEDVSHYYLLQMQGIITREEFMEKTGIKK